MSAPSKRAPHELSGSQSGGQSAGWRKVPGCRQPSRGARAAVLGGRNTRQPATVAAVWAQSGQEPVREHTHSRVTDTLDAPGPREAGARAPGGRARTG
jgi:hypothetical protein